MPIKFDSDIGSQLGAENKLKINKKSVFSLTINPNISSTPNTVFHNQLHNKMLNITKVIFGNMDNFSQIIKFRDPKHEWNDKYIKSVDLVPTVEYGRLKKWHLNASISIEHQSNIQLDRDKLIELYSDALNIDKDAIHIDIRVLGVAKNDEERLKKYVLQNRIN